MIPIHRLKIAGKSIGDDNPAYIIAEIGINHNGSVELAQELILAAQKSGADAVKFQTYITEKRVAKNSPFFRILKECELSQENHVKLFNFAKKLKITFFSTPFDKKSADFLEKLGVPAYKIASFYITHLSLIRHIAKKKIPMIVSCGMTVQKEVDSAVDSIKKYNTPFTLLHCISSYPTKDYDANLAVIPTLKEIYHVPIGFSDHTLGIKIAPLSVAAGAKLLEKHFTLDKNMIGPDHKLSSTPNEFKKMVTDIRQVEKFLGNPTIRLIPSEKAILQFRKYSK